MDWAVHYDRLINRAIGRSIDLVGYCERHHAIPRCLGGPDEERNIVLLTPEEHYVAHLLLMKMLPHRRELVFAANAMTMGVGQRSNKLFGWLRRRMAQAVSDGSKGVLKSEAHRSALSEAAKKRWADPTSRERQSEHLKHARTQRTPTPGVSGFIGVELLSNGKWRARRFVKRKPVHVGVFDTPEEARTALTRI